MNREKQYWVLFTFVTVTVAILIFLMGQTTHAVDAKTLLKEVRQELRQAQRDMFAGKIDKAISALDSIRKRLIQLKVADPNNPGLKTTENKYKKLVKDLERRTGKDLGGGTLTAAKMDIQKTLPHKPETKPMHEKRVPPSATEDAEIGTVETALSAQATKATAHVKLPHEARRPLRQATSQIGRVDGYIKRLNDPKSKFNKEQLLENIDKSLAHARIKFDEAKALAAKKGGNSHPDFDKAQADLAAAEQKAAEANQRYKEALTAPASSKDINSDVKALLVEYKRVEPLFAKATGHVMHYNDLQPVKELLSQIKNFEKSDLGKINDRMKAFAKKYGSMREDIDQKAEAMGYSGQGRASFPYTALSEGIENITKTQTVMADDLIRRASDMRDQTSKGISDFARPKQYKRIKAWGKLAAQFDQDNPRVKEFNSELDSWIEEDMKALNAKIDKVTMPSHADNAPDDAKKLSKIAVEFLQKEENKRVKKGMEVGKVLTVFITGPWRVFKKNLLGEPIQYNLPILCAVEYESDKDLNVVRVYDSTLLTEEYKGVKMAPPFLGATVGNSYYIRPSALK
ncbi:MAG: hypothetical protein SWO11_16495 [Thermodesulfobacteriota bacterium]|nr:hypothetical protein [Thermodesulfobacteriota bacterium]